MLVQQNNLEEVLLSFNLLKNLSVDTETTGLEYFDLPFSFSIANASDTFNFDSRVIPDLWSNLLVKELFLQKDRTWIFQNAKFDVKMLRRRGIEIAGKWIDIAVAARIVRNDYMGAKPYSLASQARRHGMEKDKAVDEYIKLNNCYEVRRDFFGEETKCPRFDYVPLDIMDRYAAKDARLTYDLYSLYIDQMDASDLILFKQECELTRVCFEMEEAGILVDKGFTTRALYGERSLIEEFKSLYHSLTGNEFVNSAKSAQKVLEYQLPRTEAGNPSLNDDVLEEILIKGSENDQNIAKLIQKIRHHEKRVSTYFTSYLNSMDDRNLIHPTMWQAGTRTGRFSYSDPNLQNIPKDEDTDDHREEYPVRACFIPSQRNFFLSLDYSQMEYRMMAAYANEEDVIEGVMNGEDFHKRIADLVGIKRTQAKTLNFAILYGAGEEKIANMLGCTRLEARRLKYKYFMALPKVEKFIERVIATGRSRGYVVNWMGRKLYSDPEFCYALPNHLIQGGGADVVKKAMVDIRKNLNFNGPGMVLQIHDQLVFELTDKDIPSIPTIIHIMETAFPEMNGMSLRVDASWSAKSLAERDLIKLTPEGLLGFKGLQDIQETKDEVSYAHGAP